MDNPGPETVLPDKVGGGGRKKDAMQFMNDQNGRTEDWGTGYGS